MENIDKALKEARTIAEQLLSAAPLYFRDLYVGRTKDLRRRLYTNHLHGPKTNARLKKYLVEDDLQATIDDMDAAKQYLKDHCYVKYIVKEDTIQRGRIEGLLSYLLHVRYIHEEH